jgi:diguanylate cyclase (GGDEF)-like protein
MLFKRGVYTQVVAPLLGLVLSSLTIGVYSFVRVALEKQDFLKLSIIDGLTGLFNIRHFKRVLESEVMMASTDPQISFVILMSDIDHFKQFNDSYGHQVGDLVLRETASVLKNSVRHSDVVARYGGEEMIILLRGTGLKEGLIVAEKLRKNVESRDVKDASSSYKITISIGVAAFKAGDDVEKLIKRADDALYKAKATGRNRVCSILEDFVRFPSP